MVWLFGKKAEEYKAMKKDFYSAVEKKKAELDKIISEKESYCQNGEHDLVVYRPFVNEFGRVKVVKSCKNCSYNVSEWL